MSDIYFEEKTCKNCKKINKLQIPKGTLVEDFMKDKLCFHCGCLLEGEKQ